MSNQSIGIFDSGFGGLTVMRQIASTLPQENIIYYGDTARLPYGNKSPEMIRSYAQECLSFFAKKQIKLLVIACHTVCATAFDVLEKNSSVPVVGVISPSIDALMQLPMKKPRIAILGTRATINSGIYQEKIAHTLDDAHILAIPCPLFVPLVEEGFIDHEIAQHAVHEYLAGCAVDAALLACTHYPLLTSLIQNKLGKNTRIFEPGTFCAQHVKKVLTENHLLNTDTRSPEYHFYVSDDPEKFRMHGERFLGLSIPHNSLKGLYSDLKQH